MRHTFLQQPRSLNVSWTLPSPFWTHLSPCRLLVAVCVAACLFVQPARAETSPHATAPDLNAPKGLDAQPKPVYPNGRFDVDGTAAEADTTKPHTAKPDTDEPARMAARPTAEELESQLGADPDIETLQSDSPAATEDPVLPKTPIVIANVDKTTQQMTVFVDGIEQHRWPVSTGLPGYATPDGSFTASSMNEIWYSRQWDNAPMPHAVFFTKRGHAIHGTDQLKKLGQPASKGCVRLAPENAKTFFNLVKEHGLERTEVVLTGSTPGGDYKFADEDRRYDRYQDYGRPVHPRYAPNRTYRRYGYNEIRPRVDRRRVQRPRYRQRQYRRAPRRRGNWFRAPGY